MVDARGRSLAPSVQEEFCEQVDRLLFLFGRERDHAWLR
jgi:hypothetical protein